MSDNNTPTSAAAAASAAPEAPAGNGKRRRALTALAAVVIVAGGGWGVYEWLVASHYEDTDNAYVQGNVIQITPQIGGTVMAINADDTDFVKAGQPLVQLDPADAKVSLEQAEAALAQAVRQVRTLYANNGSLAAQVTLRQSDIVKAQWDKFLMVTSFGGVGAITRAPIGITRSIPETRRLLEECLEEVLSVARARKIAMSATAVADMMKFYDGLPPSATTSLQRDIVDGKPSELEYWNGAVVRLGRESQVPTPTHAHIYDCLLPQELRARGKIAFPG